MRSSTSVRKHTRTHTKPHSRAAALFMKSRLKLQHIALLCAVCCRGISSTKIPTMIVMHHKHSNCNNLLISASRLRRSPLLLCNLSSWLYTPANYTEPKVLDLISVLLGDSKLKLCSWTADCAHSDKVAAYANGYECKLYGYFCIKYGYYGSVNEML